MYIVYNTQYRQYADATIVGIYSTELGALTAIADAIEKGAGT